MKFNTDMTFGAFVTEIDLAGLTLEKALTRFKYLLESGEWKNVGEKSDNINDFLKLVDFSDFKIMADQRKPIVKLLDELQAKNVETAKALGVNEKTIRRDINEDSANAEKEEVIDIDNEDVTNIDSANAEKEPIEEVTEPVAKPSIEEPKATDIFKAEVKKKEKEVKKVEEKEQKKAEYTERIETVSENEYSIDIFDTKETFRVIYADPAWSYNDKQDTDKLGGAAKHYDTMSIAELSALPVKNIAEKDSVLFLWVTSPLLEDAFKVINSWGFKYKTSFVWDKVKHNMGHYNSVRHEILLVCTKGSCTPDNKKLYDSVQSIERNDNHSEKPIEFLDIIDDLYNYGNKLEMFCREIKKDKWYGWGNEI